MKTLIRFAAFASAALLAAPAGAQLTHSSDIVFRFFRVDGTGPDSCTTGRCTSLSETDYPFEFTRAACTENRRYELQVSLPNDAARLGSAAARAGHAELWAGVDCFDTSAAEASPREQRCVALVKGIPLTSFTTRKVFELMAREFEVDPRACWLGHACWRGSDRIFGC
jgi:hypothetical protein